MGLPNAYGTLVNGPVGERPDTPFDNLQRLVERIYDVALTVEGVSDSLLGFDTPTKISGGDSIPPRASARFPAMTDDLYRAHVALDRIHTAVARLQKVL